MTVNNEPSLTDQQWKDDCDVNTILEKYKRTGMVTHVRRIQGRFADVSQVQDLHSGAIQIQLANDDFMALPADVRAKFDNDIYKFVEYVVDPKNKEECIKMGLMPKERPSDIKPDVSPEPKSEVKSDGSSGEV